MREATSGAFCAAFDLSRGVVALIPEPAGDPGTARTEDALEVAVAHIREEACQKRASGEFTEEFEQELSAAFERLAPVGTNRWFFDAARVHLDSAARGYRGIQVALEEFASTVGEPPEPGSGRSMTRLRALTRTWLIESVVEGRVAHLGARVSSFATGTARALEVMDQRLALVDDALRLLGERFEDSGLAERSRDSLVRELRTALEPEDVSSCAAVVIERFAELRGSVLHAECGDGSLASLLIASGHDVVGAEPRVEAAYSAMRRGVKVALREASEHLASLDEASLAAVVLSGSIDRTGTTGQLHLLELALRVLDRGGLASIVVTEPALFGSSHLEPVLRELLEWNPKSPSTWTTMMRHVGFVDIEVIELCNQPEGSSPDATRVHPSHLLVGRRPVAR
ncbi:MAG: methionine biosynthesis protein MetW [Acidimicrobiales bacterium]